MSNPQYSSAAEARKEGGPEAERRYLSQLAAWVKDRDTVYPGQSGTLSFADFRPTVGLAKSERYWDNMTDDATTKRLQEENQPPPYGDSPDALAARLHQGKMEDHQPRKGSTVKDSLKKIFHTSDHSRHEQSAAEEVMKDKSGPA